MLIVDGFAEMAAEEQRFADSRGAPVRIAGMPFAIRVHAEDDEIAEPGADLRATTKLLAGRRRGRRRAVLQGGPRTRG